MIGSIASLVLLTVGFVVVLAWVPFNRWEFVHEGRRIEIRNYGLTEAIWVDGERVPNSRVGGDFVTYAIHAVPTRSGEPLTIQVSTATLAMRCTAHLDSRMVFDSRRHPHLAVVIDDPRWPAAQTLLLELDGDPDTESSAATLRRVLRGGFEGLCRVRALAAAHRALGGDAFAAEVSRCEATVTEALQVLRELHAAAHLPRVTDSSSVTTPRSRTIRSAERAQLERVSSTVEGNA